MVCTDGEMDLNDNDHSLILVYKEKIKSAYKDDVFFYDSGKHRRFYIGDDKYKPEINSDNYYESDESDDNGGDGSDGADELLDLLKNLSTSDKEKKTAD
ncbi:hypothetical protein DDB_G0291736 [Dictyostelium discoideum AX4]|uniref:Uncharacterized protein n=1 Tax=Dictyostelium discoideum TaxID=44689 RepID=Q54E94_DICDI|nr:hypothetical protein DDB_G0291736 [Dictyostelium discoideum AX4]EAL61564.1 hypothetical protein DDB_G0291736 [Dictyostelium discoideum AX4]|eukprot:XP_629968.1 hypothetical protein DDB_G0291736 [Dictyostelium discoideum AX4]